MRLRTLTLLRLLLRLLRLRLSASPLSTCTSRLALLPQLGSQLELAKRLRSSNRASGAPDSLSWRSGSGTMSGGRSRRSSVTP